MSNYEDLLAQKRELGRQAAELERQITLARKEAQASVIAEIKKLMQAHGLTPVDIAGISANVDRKSESGRSKVAPKYIMPGTGETWSGRGLMPRWLKAAILEGKSIDEFKV